MSSASSSKKINPTDDTDTDTTENTSSASTITSPNEETKIIHWSQWDLTYESSRLISIGSSDLLVTKYTRAHHDRVSKIWFENKFVNEPENLDAFYDETIKNHEILTKKILKASSDYFKKIHLQVARDLGVVEEWNLLPDNIHKSMAAFKLYDISTILDTDHHGEVLQKCNNRTLRYYKFYLLCDGIFDIAPKDCVNEFAENYMQENNLIYVKTSKVKVPCISSIVRKSK